MDETFLCITTARCSCLRIMCAAGMTLGAAERDMQKRERSMPLPSLPQLLADINTAFASLAVGSGRSAAGVNSDQAQEVARMLHLLGKIMDSTKQRPSYETREGVASALRTLTRVMCAPALELGPSTAEVLVQSSLKVLQQDRAAQPSSAPTASLHTQHQPHRPPQRQQPSSEQQPSALHHLPVKDMSLSAWALSKLVPTV